MKSELADTVENIGGEQAGVGRVGRLGFEGSMGYSGTGA